MTSHQELSKPPVSDYAAQLIQFHFFALQQLAAFETHPILITSASSETTIPLLKRVEFIVSLWERFCKTVV